MDTTTIIIATLAATSIVGLAWLGGYRLGLASGVSAERELADRRIAGLLAAENKRKPKSQKAKRKVARKVAIKTSGGALW